MLVGVSLVPSVITAPLFGRLLDRIGAATWTPRLLVVGALARMAVAPAFALHAPVWVLITCALAGQMVSFGVFGSVRALLNGIVPRRLTGSALSINSIFAEVVVITAPFLVVASALASPAYALVAMGAAMLVGAVLVHPKLMTRVAAEPADEPAIADQSAAEAPVPASAGVWTNRAFLFWLLVTLSFGHLLGTADVGVLPRVALDGGGTAEAAILTAVLGAASAATGFLYAWYRPHIKLGLVAQAVILMLLMIASSLAIATVGGWWGLVLAFIALGLCTAPLNTVMNEAPGYVVPPERSSESFSILVAANGIGIAVAGGLLGVVSVHQMLLLGSVTPVVVLLVAPLLLRRRAGQAAA
jgi:MFS family permease